MKNFFFLLLITSFFSCDYIDEPFFEDNNTINLGKKILLEEFTGHKCPNCPRAHEKIEFLMQENQFSNQIIPVAIHAGSFAATNTTYPTDYTSEAGDAIHGFFNINSYPSGLVNRIDYSSDHIKSYEDWATEIADILSDGVPPVEIQITNQFNNSTRDLNCNINLTFNHSLEGPFMLSLWITEDNLISRQQDNQEESGYIEDYTHMHVLRGAINNTWGDSLSGVTFNIGDVINKDYTLNINSEFNENNCNVVAFVYNQSTYEVIQADLKSFLQQ